MSQALTSTPKPKAQPFRIVFPVGTPPQRKVGRPKKNSMSDLEAAIHSITEDGVATSVSDANSFIRTVGKTPQKILTFNAPSEGGNKVEKIVFLPKFIQKKVTVLREPLPKKIIRTDLSPVVPGKSRSIVVSQGGSALRDIVAAVNDKVNSLPKKRKLGDIALESWQANRKPTPSLPSPAPVFTPAEPAAPPVLCRLCGTTIQDQVVDLFDEAGAMTQTGAKLKTITGNEVFDSTRSPTGCCKQCSMKVQVCFSLLVELQAADEVARDTFTAANDSEVNPSVRIFTCKDCDQEVIGMRDFVKHHEAHVQERAIGSRNLLSVSKVENVSEKKEPALSLLDSARQFLDDDLEDDGQPIFQNEEGQFVCELCGRIFKYKYQLLMHRKAPRRPPKPEAASSNCFACGQAKAGMSQCKLMDGNLLLICNECKENVTVMVV